jgi:endonuclease YncB( thermonuclease family)
MENKLFYLAVAQLFSENSLGFRSYSFGGSEGHARSTRIEIRTAASAAIKIKGVGLSSRLARSKVDMSIRSHSWIPSGYVDCMPYVIALLFLFMFGPAVAATLSGQADIVDGDTIKVGSIPVRFYGIDAPEGRQTCERNGKTYGCGKQATKALADLIAKQSVQCEIVGRDDYGRVLGVCTVAGIELNRAMVRNGWAFAFAKYSDRYVPDQDAAEAAKAGLWAGSFVKPWEWRLGQTQAAEKTQACAIKGNIKQEWRTHLSFALSAVLSSNQN